MKYLYDYIFYNIYTLNKIIGKDFSSSYILYSTSLLLTASESCILIMLLLKIDDCFKEIPFIRNSYFIFILGIIIQLLNILYFEANKRYLIIEEKFSNKDVSKSSLLINTFFYLIVLSPLIFYLLF